MLRMKPGKVSQLTVWLATREHRAMGPDCEELGVEVWNVV
jgi:hypothetical protein